MVGSVISEELFVQKLVHVLEVSGRRDFHELGAKFGRFWQGREHLSGHTLQICLFTC